MRIKYSNSILLYRVALYHVLRLTYLVVQVWRALRSLADRVACELSTIRFGSLKPQPSLTPDGRALLVALIHPAGALIGEGEALYNIGCFHCCSH